jgi:soluble lytic murein transglycosylase-like protein
VPEDARPADDASEKLKTRAEVGKGSSDLPPAYKPRKSACEAYAPMITDAAKRHGLEPELVMGVVKVESGFNPDCRSRVGARGLMQIMPRTANHLSCGADLWDPETNLECGCKVLRRYFDLYDGNVIYGLAAYNAGPGNANPSAKGRYLPFNFQYVEKILKWRNAFVRHGCL